MLTSKIQRQGLGWLVAVVLCVLAAPAMPADACIVESELENGRTCTAPVRRVRPVRTEPAHTPLDPDTSPISYTVAQVITANVPVFANPADYYEQFAPVRELGKGYLWVSVLDSTEVQGELWYRINPDEYVRAVQLAIMKPSHFQGVTLPQQPGAPFGFVLAWMRPSTTAGGPANPDAAPVSRYEVVTIFETSEPVDGVVWYRIGPDRWVPQTALGVVTVDAAPEGVGPDERWIEVDLFEQTLAAYQGRTMVYATLVSTGLRGWDTEPGLFRIWAKLERWKMSGREGRPDYYNLEDVPWIMYFNRDMALHGAYWHDRFGYPHSHGCVNLSPLDAQWLFNWTSPAYPEGVKIVYPSETDQGTWVWVH